MAENREKLKVFSECDITASPIFKAFRSARYLQGPCLVMGCREKPDVVL
jgi:hypothetical protein